MGDQGEEKTRRNVRRVSKLGNSAPYLYPLNGVIPTARRGFDIPPLRRRVDAIILERKHAGANLRGAQSKRLLS